MILAGCGRAGTPAPSASASTIVPPMAPSPSPSPISSPSSALPELPTTASAEKDGVRLTATLERNPLPSGEPTWVTTEVRNVGTDDLVWLHGGCRIAAHVGGIIEGAHWRPGREQTGKAAEFKTRALSYHGGAGDEIGIGFTPEPWIGRGPIACSAIGIEEIIPPGGAIIERAQWDGMVGRFGPAHEGEIQLVASFGDYWRASTGQPDDLTAQRIVVSIGSAVVDGRDPALLDPAEVLDAALADPGFAAWIEGIEDVPGVDPVLRMAPDTHAWWVGTKGDAVDAVAPMHLVLVHPRSGAVLATIDRDWDYRTEGNP